MSEALRKITGWAPRKYSVEFEDPLAHNKFVVFALVSSLLVPKAAKLFRRALQDERTQTLNEHRRLRMLRKQQREKDESARLKKRIDELYTALFDSCYSADATAKNISESRPPFPPPHWTGEPRPHGARRVKLHSNFPSAGDLHYLVSELGYDGSAAFAATAQGHQWWLRVSDRRHANGFSADQQTGQNHGYSNFAPAHPYYPVSPARRTKVGGGLPKQDVVRALEQRGWDDNTRAAIFDVVYYKLSARQVAAQRGLKVATIYQYASRLRGDLRAA